MSLFLYASLSIYLSVIYIHLSQLLSFSHSSMMFYHFCIQKALAAQCDLGGSERLKKSEANKKLGM